MKMELKTKQNKFGGWDEYIYITRNAFMKGYLQDKEKAFHEFNSIIEMFSGLICISGEADEEEFDKIYEVLQKSKCKGVTIEFDEDEEGINISCGKVKIW